MASGRMEDLETTNQETWSSSSETETGEVNPNWQSTLRITHPALLAATQNDPSRRLVSAPFIVLGAMPPNLGSTEDLESSRDLGSSEEVKSTAVWRVMPIKRFLPS
jgi:hypothetical protein